MKNSLLTYLHKTQGRDLSSLSDTLLKKSADGAPTDELVDDALELALQMNVEYLANQAPAEIPKAEYDKIHKAAKADTLAKVEEEIKKTHVVEGKDWKEMVANVGAKAAKTANSDDAWEIDARTAKLKADYDAKIATVQAESDARIQQVESETQRRERFKSNLPKIDAAMASAGFVLPANPVAAANQKADFLKLFEGFDFEEKETGTYLKQGDDYVKDGHKIPVKLEDYVTSLGSARFDVQKQPDRQSPGVDNPGTPPAQKWAKDNLPKTKDELSKVYFQTPVAEKAELMAAWNAANPQGQ